MSFWNFRASDKWDEIDIVRHPKLWSGALSDPDTGAYALKRGEYVLYGPEEALLFRPKRAVFRVGMELYLALLSLIKEQPAYTSDKDQLNQSG